VVTANDVLSPTAVATNSAPQISYLDSRGTSRRRKEGEGKKERDGRDERQHPKINLWLRGYVFDER